MSYCIECTNALTNDEIHYYEETCEMCIRKGSKETATQPQAREALKPCPWCASRAKWKLDKVYHCQLHGEPSQSVIVYCDFHKCAAKPKAYGGDVYNGGQNDARDKAAVLWNTRAESAEITALREFSVSCMQIPDKFGLAHVPAIKLGAALALGIEYKMPAADQRDFDMVSVMLKDEYKPKLEALVNLLQECRAKIEIENAHSLAKDIDAALTQYQGGM